jgi:glycosyltransferase involved in cell wall biosynthesis
MSGRSSPNPDGSASKKAGNHGKIKVLLVANGLNNMGGIEKFVLELMQEKGLAEKVDFRVLTPSMKGEKTAGGILSNYGSGIMDRITGLDTFTIGDFTFPKAGTIATALKEYKRADVIYLTNLSSSFTIFLAPLLLRYRKKSIFAFHNPYMSEMFCYGRGARYRIFNSVRLWFILSFFSNFHVINKGDLQKLRKNKPNSSVYYIPNSASAIFETQAGPRARNSKFTAIFVGRLDRIHKGTDLLEQIIGKVYEKVDKKKIRFRIVGPEGEGIGEVRRLCSNQRYDVQYTGRIDSIGRLFREYNSADLFLLPSRSEPFGIALLAAGLCGLPAVAFDVQGPRDIIINNKTGKLVKPYDVGEFAESILHYLHRWELGRTDNRYIAKSMKARFGRSRAFESIYRMFASIKHRNDRT